MNVILIGFMASGKTSVGRRLAQRLGYNFLDTDQFIESELGCTIAEVFSIQGEAYFRKLESRLAARLHCLQNTVISTGGGLPITPGNLERLREAGSVVFIKASLEDILKRLERDVRRPMVQRGELRETVTSLLEERLPSYEQADLVVESHGKGVNRVCGEIIRHLAELRARHAARREAAAQAAQASASSAEPV
jgi:shikimate kinase